MSERESNPLRAAFILSVLMLAVLAVVLAGCAPTPFVVGDVVAPPAGCVEARERGHAC